MTTDPREVLTRPAPPPDRTLRYGDHPDHVIDLRLPKGEARCLVVFIHGGFWRAEYDRTNAGAGPFAADLAARGWPVATIEYRRVGQPGGGWPGTFDDIRAALDAVPSNGSLILAGHSAGGHLALWYAARHPAPVLALAPVADLAEAYRRGIGDGAVAGLLGGGPQDVPERYTAAQPGAVDAPVILIHGIQDDKVPVELSRRYAAATRARLRELPGIEHFGLIDPESSAWPQVIGALTELDQTLTNQRPKG